MFKRKKAIFSHFLFAQKCTLEYNVDIMKGAKKDADCPRPKTVSFRLPDPLMAELRRLAKLNRRTLSGEVQIALEKHLQNNGSSTAPDQNQTPLL